MSAYVPLWVKSNFSFLEGASHPEELVETAAELGIERIALTDRDGVPGVVEAHVKARELGIRLIIGSEVTVEPPGGVVGSSGGAPSTIVLLAMDRGGYANLCRLVTAGRRRSAKGECSVRWPEVLEHAPGLIALWGGDSSLPVLAPDGDPGVDRLAGSRRETFGDRLHALVARHRRAEGPHVLPKVHGQVGQAEGLVVGDGAAGHLA